MTFLWGLLLHRSNDSKRIVSYIIYILSIRIWIHCFRLALCLREGSSSRECTLLSPAELVSCPSLVSDTGLKDTAKSESLSSSEGVAQRRAQGNSLSSHPAADHALAYTILDTGVSMMQWVVAILKTLFPVIL